MRMSSPRARLILGFVGLLTTGWLAAAPLDVVRKCATTAAPTLSGVESLESVCPGLQDALASLRFNEIFIDGWQQKINAHALQDVSGLAERYSQAQGHAPDTGSLAGVLESLQAAQTPKMASWWQSLKSWLKNWLAHSDSALADWLNRLLDRWSVRSDVSVTFLKLVTYCLSALVAIAAVVIIVREFRAAGIGRRATRMAQAKSAGATAQQTDLELALVPGSATDAWAVLLRALVRRLLQLGRLRADRSLTHRELVARSLFETEEQRAAFAGVAHGAEANFYGPRDRAPAPADEAKRRGEALLAQLAELKSKS
jgi:hypothetical protein